VTAACWLRRPAHRWADERRRRPSSSSPTTRPTFQFENHPHDPMRPGWRSQANLKNGSRSFLCSSPEDPRTPAGVSECAAPPGTIDPAILSGVINNNLQSNSAASSYLQSKLGLLSGLLHWIFCSSPPLVVVLQPCRTCRSNRTCSNRTCLRHRRILSASYLNLHTSVCCSVLELLSAVASNRRDRSTRRNNGLNNDAPSGRVKPVGFRCLGNDAHPTCTKT
jgi:hypothetical protein